MRGSTRSMQFGTAAKGVWPNHLEHKVSMVRQDYIHALRRPNSMHIFEGRLDVC